MRTTGYASLAVVGVAACFAVYALTSNQVMSGSDLKSLGTPLTQADYEFFKYVTKYGKSYGTKEEFEFRAEIFKSNLEHIANRNSQNDLTYTLGVNKFADLTNAEFKKRLGRKKATNKFL